MLSPSDRQVLLTLARERISAELLSRDPSFPAPTPSLTEPMGAFVTLHLLKDGTRLLRGCIGQVEATGSLYDTVRSVAYSAAFRDPRFPPLSARELGSIELEISVLSPLTAISDPAEVEPGVHGLMIERGSRSGLLLPQVAAERNWDRLTFLQQTCRKAGLPEDAWEDPGARIRIFTAEVFDETSLRM
jgi:AmmeMemoRadiSam system protein A